MAIATAHAEIANSAVERVQERDDDLVDEGQHGAESM